MSPDRFRAITSRYAGLRLAVIGDFCLDRYLEIDPSRQETSIETGLPVHNVVNVRAQPGGAGTILNNLVALGVGEIIPVGFCGDDGEGYELRRGLASLPRVRLDHFLTAQDRRTFTYCKPLVLEPGRVPRELSRLDSKNWTPTSSDLQSRLIQRVRQVLPEADAVVILAQVDVPDTGVVTRGMLDVLGHLAGEHPGVPVIADSRGGLRGWPRVSFKMNMAELASLLGERQSLSVGEVGTAAAGLAASNGRPVFVTLSERGILAAAPGGEINHVPSLPVRGPIDIVGAGDSVTANLATALAAGATLREAIELAAVASSHVIHQLGTTGTAGVDDLGLLIDQIPGAPQG
jgi:rfaE bifunctional protein kinase chain/domain